MEEMGGKMRETTSEDHEEEEDDEYGAEINIWKYIFGNVEMAVVKCAIELGIAEAMEAHGRPITLSDLSASLGCSSSSLHRIMRFLVHRKLFKEKNIGGNGTKCYALTPVARLLMNHEERSMAAFVLLESSPIMLAPWHALSVRVRDEERPPFEGAHGEDIWDFAAENPEHSKLFNDAMACDARMVVPVIVNSCADVFEGISTVVDVGGGDGTTLGLLVKAFPWIKGINFDLPHVVSVAPERNRVEHVGGDMFEAVPRADAAFLMRVLHDWGDEECIEILKKCSEAVPKDKGKVIIVEAVIEEEHNKESYNKLKGVALMLDMAMMAHTNKGKERTKEEWEHVLKQAGFTGTLVRPIPAVQSVIVAYNY